GNSVNSKMGNAAYLLFYLAAGIFAGVGFVSGAQNPCLGASGAIAGVTTAFLVLFPHSGITTFYWLWFYIGTMHIRAMLLIVAKIILWDNIISPSLSSGHGYSQVAYSAHIAGYFFGFTLCLFLLWIRALPRDQYDILALIKRFYQRQQFKAVMADPNARAQATFGRVAKTVSVHTGRPVEARAVAVDSEVVRLRAEIAELVNRGDYTGAADRYESLVVRDPSQCLPRQNMLMVANQLMTLGRYPQAAAAYEKHLETYPGDRDILQIKFLLGIIYAKYLQQHEAAEGFLRECAKRLTDPDQKKQATEWYQTVLTALGRGPSTTET
ncbi:MAG: rhomboid family intramembrane serine protease, partial [Phycisphaerae bacterium]